MVFFRVAARNLSRNKRRTLLTLLTMVFGLMTLALVKGYANAVRKVQLESTVYGTTGMIQISAKGYQKNVLVNPISMSFLDSPELRKKIVSIPGVKALSGRITFSALFSLPPSSSQGDEQPSTPLTLIAIDPENEKNVVPELFNWIDSGSMIASKDAPEILLTRALAQSLGIEPEHHAANHALPIQEIGTQNQKNMADTSTWPALLANDPDGNLGGLPVQFVGTLSAVLPGDKRFGYLSLSKAQELLRMESRLTTLVLNLDSIDLTETIRDELEQVLGPTFEVTTWDELAPYVKDILHNVDLIFALVTAIFILVIGLGVANSLLMTVMERKQEIGTMMAVGTTRSQIASLFTIEGLLIGLVGGAAGTVFGFILVVIVHNTGIKLSAPGSDVKIILRTFVTSDYLAVSFLSTPILSACVSLWPALRASSLKPVEALQST